MTHSLSPHCVLTEPVCKNMSGKGREGNKEGKGRYWWLATKTNAYSGRALKRGRVVAGSLIGLGVSA